VISGNLRRTVNSDGARLALRHCEERSDEAIQSVWVALDCFASLALTSSYVKLDLPDGRRSQSLVKYCV